MKTIKPNKQNLLWGLFLGVFFVFQFYNSLQNKNLFPFSSHNFFAYNVPDVVVKTELILRDKFGNEVAAHPAHFMEIEFFKANRIIAKLFMSGEFSNAQKSDFMRFIVERIKKEPWDSFDETFQSVSLRDDFELKSISFDIISKNYGLNENGSFIEELSRETAFVYEV
ncbi:hypothetical protein, partial [Vibrio cholerae]|uniref:hypothetical protein n=3 Tax=Vibrionaceae TaxID=641 RepID=UPI00216053AB